ncbi:homeobox-leucine zipper protein HAT22-like [Neltuma alba]|uniref:homeobox-leucine zipper protein HAT22-like n=1 Tax=Neltuma alba TaxID=207710 RepID=UPI0010A4F01A|nr:homeobox-leucine zipper protein HAT22-like [Prosopis alba]XP_028774177.1 homeobox-leucine zipper protein HAT22-like [Prosopis alba]
MEDDGTICNTRLSLGLGIGGYVMPLKEEKFEEAIVHNHDQRDLISLKTRIDEEEDEKSDHRNSCRKKLRLTQEQSAMLEDSFKLHSSLNPLQKQELAHRLNLKPRQIEVWFQNRRARKKLKQTEVDCELLRKCCENLRNENRRLKKEVEELRALKNGTVQLSRALCSSCEKPLIKGH